MTSADDKDPPVPNDLVGASKRVHHDRNAPRHDLSIPAPLTDEPDDKD